MADYTEDQVGRVLKRLGHYRVVAAQEAANEGPSDGISGALLLALGLRESGLQNINNAAETDHGCFQISELFHLDWLSKQPGCEAGTWVAVSGHNAADTGYCPRYTPALTYALGMLKDAVAFGRSKGVKEADLVRFAVASYNGGLGGALSGYKAGDVDKYTTGGDYSAWTLRNRLPVQHWLDHNPTWKPA